MATLRVTVKNESTLTATGVAPALSWAGYVVSQTMLAHVGITCGVTSCDLAAGAEQEFVFELRSGTVTGSGAPLSVTVTANGVIGDSALQDTAAAPTITVTEAAVAAVGISVEASAQATVGVPFGVQIRLDNSGGVDLTGVTVRLDASGAGATVQAPVELELGDLVRGAQSMSLFSVTASQEGTVTLTGTVTTEETGSSTAQATTPVAEDVTGPVVNRGDQRRPGRERLVHLR